MLVWRGSCCPGLVVLVYLVRPDRVCSVLLCSVSLHWFGRGCSVPGRCVVVALSLVLFALFRSGVVLFALDWSALAFLVGLLFYSLVCSKLGCPACCARAGLVRQRDCNIISSCLSQYVGRGQGSAAGAAEDHMTCLYLLKGA